MNRYLFKAKRKDNNQWVYGYLVEWVNCCTVYMNAPSPKRSFIFPFENRGCLQTLENHIEVDSKTLCACTGLQDIEGNYIFENDILVNHCHYKVLVKFGEYEYLGLKHYGFYIQDVEFSDVFNLWGAGCKLIGNKFDKENE